mmetsp:Transcript_7528/g.8200  ORF Transcript_7528/g.8200 Transcript_7528/m.8200 type:complete len:85 (+) Transcript_7528:519-773(+)
MTIMQLCKVNIKVDVGDAVAVGGGVVPVPLDEVDSNTPKTIAANEAISDPPNVSIPHMTATEALVIGSAALIVSTKAAELPAKQ